MGSRTSSAFRPSRRLDSRRARTSRSRLVIWFGWQVNWPAGSSQPQYASARGRSGRSAGRLAAHENGRNREAGVGMGTMLQVLRGEAGQAGRGASLATAGG
jgi:hypothetical protein